MEIEPLFRLRSPYEKASYFYSLVIKRELQIRHSFLSQEEATSFATYYGYKDNDQANHFVHRHAQRVQHLVGAVTEGAKTPDAGCLEEFAK